MKERRKINNARQGYFDGCKEGHQYALPIFDHIRDKTLVLVNYTLSMGICVGLAKAFYNEPDIVNSFIL